MAPWLSVAMPVHNGQHLLGATLDSAAAEMPDGVEFILFDSSPDPEPTRRIAESFQSRLNLRYEATPDLLPWTAKTNRAVAEARAPHVAMLHQDDLWRAGHLSALRAALTFAPEAAFSIGPSCFIDDDGRPLGPWNLPFRAGLYSGETFTDTLIVQNSIAIPAPLIRRDLWLSCGGLDDALWYTADWDLYLKLARLGPVLVRPEATTAFRLHRGSLTVKGARNADAFRDQLQRVVNRHLPETIGKSTAKLAQASVEVNCFLAAALYGAPRRPLNLLRVLLSLGPMGLARYLHRSRLIDRLLPRLRLRRAGGL